MIVVVLFAMLRAGVADFGAQPADGGSELGSPTHVTGRSPADLCAVLIQTDAFCHGGNVLFAQACIAAVFACLGAFHAGFDT